MSLLAVVVTICGVSITSLHIGTLGQAVGIEICVEMSSFLYDICKCFPNEILM